MTKSTSGRAPQKPRTAQPIRLDPNHPLYPEFQADFANKTLDCTHRPAHDCSCCWFFGMGINKQDGYGMYNIPVRLRPLFPPDVVALTANRAGFLAGVQPWISKGQEIDHICHKDDGSCEPRSCTHRACVRPSHLATMDAKSNRKQIARKKRLTCRANLHLVTPANTGRTASGRTYCEDCRLMKAVERQEAKDDRARAKAGVGAA